MVVPRSVFDQVSPGIRPADDVRPEGVLEDLDRLEVDPTHLDEVAAEAQLITVKDGIGLPTISAFRLLAARLKELGRSNPILLKDTLAAVPAPGGSSAGSRSAPPPRATTRPTRRP